MYNLVRETKASSGSDSCLHAKFVYMVTFIKPINRAASTGGVKPK